MKRETTIERVVFAHSLSQQVRCSDGWYVASVHLEESIFVVNRLDDAASISVTLLFGNMMNVDSGGVTIAAASVVYHTFNDDVLDSVRTMLEELLPMMVYHAGNNTRYLLTEN